MRLVLCCVDSLIIVGHHCWFTNMTNPRALAPIATAFQLSGMQKLCQPSIQCEPCPFVTSNEPTNSASSWRHRQQPKQRPRQGQRRVSPDNMSHTHTQNGARQVKNVSFIPHLVVGPSIWLASHTIKMTTQRHACRLSRHAVAVELLSAVTQSFLFLSLSVADQWPKVNFQSFRRIKFSCQKVDYYHCVWRHSKGHSATVSQLSVNWPTTGQQRRALLPLLLNFSPSVHWLNQENAPLHKYTFVDKQTLDKQFKHINIHISLLKLLITVTLCFDIDQLYPVKVAIGGTSILVRSHQSHHNSDVMSQQWTGSSQLSSH